MLLDGLIDIANQLRSGVLNWVHRMQPFGRCGSLIDVKAVRLLVSVALMAALAACSSGSTDRGQGSPDPAPTAPVRVTLIVGCPASVAGHDGVENNGPGLKDEIVPLTPTAGLLCRYSPLGGLQAPGVKHGVLYGQATLTAAQARTLASLLNRIPPYKRGEVFHCPADVGRHSILTFAAPGRSDVDVWVSDTGCPYVSNGHRQAGEPSPALGDFLSSVDDIVPARNVVRSHTNASVS